MVRYFYRTSYVSSGSFAVVPEPNPQNRIIMQRTPPMFPPNVWNVWGATLRNESRTNNICEGWNSKFYKLIGYPHPPLWRFLEAIRQEDGAVRFKLHQISVGDSEKHILPEHLSRFNTRLHNLCLRKHQNDITMEEFLNGVARNICHVRTLN